MTTGTTITVEESRALLELGAGQCLTSEIFTHLRAALDREAEALAEIARLRPQGVS